MGRMSTLGRRTVAAAVVVATTAAFVGPGGPVVAAVQPEDGVLWGSIRYSERGPGATYDGIANAFILGSFAPVAATRAGGAVQLVFELLQNPALAETMGTDMASITDRIRQVAPAGTPPIRASYDAFITFRLEAEDGGSRYRLSSGSVAWTTKNTTVLSAEDITFQDDFFGSGTDPLDPATDVIDLTFEERDDGTVAWTLDVEISHPYVTSGESSWTSPMGTVSIVRKGSNVEMGGTAMGMQVPIPPLPPDLAADQEKTISYLRLGTLEAAGGAVRSSETWTNILEGTQVVQVEIVGSCTPAVAAPDPPRLVFDDDTPGRIEDEARLRDLPGFARRAVRWEVDVPFDATYTPEDLVGPAVKFEWSGLPEDTVEFGKRVIDVEYTDPTVEKICRPIQPLTVEVFFPIDAENNPEGETPNWFYYWMQTSARNGIDKVRVVDDCGGDKSVGKYRKGDEYLRLCDPETYQLDVRAADGVLVAYIDNFAITLIHENRHRENSENWWRGGMKVRCWDVDRDGKDDPRPGCVMDIDEDDVPDALEPAQVAPDGRNLGLEVGDKYSCSIGGLTKAQLESVGISDEECTAYWEEIRWQIGSARTEDWAAPGSQWGDGRP